jgi:small subunit ribosomal protein S9
MKKPETKKKEMKEIKKKAAAPKKVVASKEKKEIKKAPAKVAKKIEKPEAIKIEKIAVVHKPEPVKTEKAHVVHEEHKIHPQPVRVIEKKKPPKIQQFHGTGGRKTSKARVWMTIGNGVYLINGRPMEQYALGRTLLTKQALEPFVVTNTVGKYNVYAYVQGGGYASGVGAVRHAVSDAMATMNLEFRPALKKAGLLTRDPRMKERKKYGQKRARKRFQYSKR